MRVVDDECPEPLLEQVRILPPRQVETGVEYYDIDASTGELRYDVSPVT